MGGGRDRLEGEGQAGYEGVFYTVKEYVLHALHYSCMDYIKDAETY